MNALLLNLNIMMSNPNTGANRQQIHKIVTKMNYSSNAKPTFSMPPTFLTYLPCTVNVITDLVSYKNSLPFS